MSPYFAGTLLPGDLHAPIGRAVRGREPRLGVGGVLRAAQDLELRVARDHLVVVRHRELADRGLRSQCAVRSIADPAGEQDSGAPRLALRLRHAIVEHRHVRVRHEHVGLAAASGAIARLGRPGFLHRALALIRDHPHHRLVVPGVEPRERGVALDRGDQRILLRDPFARLGLVALGAKAQLVGARELLHHAHALHRHGVRREAEAVGTLGRNVLDAEGEDRVGPASRGQGHFACAGYGETLALEGA
jgi:hypothetical protein